MEINNKIGAASARMHAYGRWDLNIIDNPFASNKLCKYANGKFAQPWFAHQGGACTPCAPGRQHEYIMTTTTKNALPRWRGFNLLEKFSAEERRQ